MAVDLLNHVKCGAWGETEDAHGIAHDARAHMMADHQLRQRDGRSKRVKHASNQNQM